MSQLIVVEHSVPVVSHRVIADGTGNHAQNIKELIDDYKSDFEEFGVIRFETEKGKGRPTITYYLNESQATLLLTYLRNSPVVRAFKIALVKEFYEMRERLYNKDHEIVIKQIPTNERIGTLEVQLHNAKREVTELRRALNRVLYNITEDAKTGDNPQKLLELLEKGLKYDALNKEKLNLEAKFIAMANNGMLQHLESLVKTIKHIGGSDNDMVQITA